MKKLLSVFLSIVMIVTTVAIVPITAYAGHRCPICDEWIDGDPYCEECYMCGDCAETYGGFCEGCQALCIICANGDFCEDCHQCLNCVDLCSECGSHCYECQPGCEECNRCGHCLENDGMELCTECQAVCIECVSGSFCRDCVRCRNCVQMCEECDGYCMECSKGCEDCGRCGYCLEDDGIPNCDDCGRCEDCVGELCEECGRCRDCAPQFCENCGEACADCRKICGDCGLCTECNGDTICESCGNACGECSKICENCHTCENCAQICENGDHCSECATLCDNCGLCEDCTTICEGCGSYCSECADVFCEECNRCSECAIICKGCGRCHDCIGGSFCENCGTCSNCATLCNDEKYCAACSKVCKSCGKCDAEAKDSNDAICSQCNLCNECSGKRACVVCEKCSDCTTFTKITFNGEDDYNVICDKCIDAYPDMDDLTVDFGDMIIGQPINFYPTVSGKSAKYITSKYIAWYKANGSSVTSCNHGDLFEAGYEYYPRLSAYFNMLNVNMQLVADVNFVGFETYRYDTYAYFGTYGNESGISVAGIRKFAQYPEYDSNSLYAIAQEALYISARDITAVTTYIASGKIHTNDTVVIITPDGTVKKVKVLYMEMFRKQLDEAIKGDSCAIAFARSDISPSEIPAGSLILADNGTILPYTPAGSRISGAFSMLNVEGTNVASMSNGSDVKVNVGGQSYTGKIYSSNGEDFKENSEVSAILVLDSAVPIYNSQELSITYDSHYIGDFKVDTLIKATDFNITKREYECKLPDAHVKIEAEFYPAGATYGVKWESLNPDIATVDSLGNVKSHTAGTAIIRASLGDKVIDCVVNIGCNHFFRYKQSGKESTCTEHGYTDYYTCKYCYVTRDKEELPLKPHEYEFTSETAPTCSMEGAKVYTCTVCGGTMTESISKLPHTFDDNAEKCSVCGADNPIYAKPKPSDTTPAKDDNVSAPGTTTPTSSNQGSTSNGASTPAKIKVPAITLTSVKSKKSKQITATWKKNTSVNGYEIQYSTDKNFKKSVKKVVVKKNKTISTTIKKLQSKKKYYVRIRAYKTVNGKKYYSSWSKAKTVTTKK